MSLIFKNIKLILITLSLIGLLDSLYLSYARYMHVDLPCSITNGGCSIVAASPYAVIMGMPLAYLGVLFYIFIISIVFLYIFKPNTFYIKEIILTTSIFGALDSLYFIYLQAYVIKAFCIYCIISAIITFILVPLAYLLYKKG